MYSEVPSVNKNDSGSDAKDVFAQVAHGCKTIDKKVSSMSLVDKKKVIGLLERYTKEMLNQNQKSAE